MAKQQPKSIRVAYGLLKALQINQDWPAERILREASESRAMTKAIGWKSKRQFPDTQAATAVFAVVLTHAEEFASLVETVKEITAQLRGVKYARVENT